MACKGYDIWNRGNNVRADKLENILTRVKSSTSYDFVLLSEASKDIQKVTFEQRQSSPPPEAVKLNGMLVEMLNLYYEVSVASMNKDAIGVSNASDRFDFVAEQIDAEDARVNGICG